MSKPRIIRINLRRDIKKEPVRKKRFTGFKRPHWDIKVKVDVQNPYFPLVFFLLLGVVVALVWDYRLLKEKKRLQALVDRKRQELVLLRKKVKAVAKIKKELDELESKRRIIKAIIEEAHKPLKVIKSFEKAMPDEVWLVWMRLDDKKISFRGYALNDDVLADFLENLQKQKDLIASVRVGRYEKAKVNSVDVKRFSGTVVLR